jgi:Protein of unknown function (DUF3574)
MRCLATVALVMWLGGVGVASAAAPSGPASGPTAAGGASASIALAPGTWFTRTELFFGSLMPDGSVVSEEAFLGFLNAEITPRFPNGLTLLTGLGQFLTAQGVMHQESSRLLILIYPVEEERDSSEKIEQIREKYKRMFHQEAVLRADRCCELVRF